MCKKNMQKNAKNAKKCRLVIENTKKGEKKVQKIIKLQFNVEKSSKFDE